MAKKKISANISFKEATVSETATKLGIDNTPTEEHLEAMVTVAEKIFQPLREWCNHPIRINSFYRSKALNMAVKGSLTSSHSLGEAIDVDSLGEKTNAELFTYIKDNLDFDQLIWEFGTDLNPDWIHFSYTNENRKQILKAIRKRGKVQYHVI